jgi:hypothetical protein
MTDQSIEDASRNSIIEDANRREFERHIRNEPGFQEFMLKRHEENGSCYAINDIQTGWVFWQAARQSNNVAVAWTNVTHSGVITETHRQYLAEHYPNSPNDKITPLYTSPQHSNALEMAAKLYDAIDGVKSSFNNSDFQNGWECAKYNIHHAIRNLITQPESDGK